jgi:Zn-dependent protease
VTRSELPETNDFSRRCTTCRTELPPSFLTCPSCSTLVHADRLKALAADASGAERNGDLAKAVEIWTSMIDLLPPGSVQHQRLSQMSADGQERLRKEHHPNVGQPTAAPKMSNVKKRSGILVGLTAIGLLLLKFKWALLFLLGKGKLLLLGLLQAKTFLSMGLALWVYIAAWGWKFAVGLVVSIYIHEMGHVAWLRRYGIAATAPMFIPGVGAFVRLRQHPQSLAQDARIGMAGPLWGLLAACFFLIVGLLVPWRSWVAIGAIGAWINMFNLLPIWQLDGGRAWKALSRRERGWASAALWGMALFVGDGLFFIIAIAGTLRAVMGKAPEKGDRGAAWSYIVLAAVLTLLMHLARLSVGEFQSPLNGA